MVRSARKSVRKTEAPSANLRVCEHPGCAEAGEFRAPRSRENLSQYRWFCLEHVREYNSRWNYYAGMQEAEIEAHTRADVTWRRPTWPLGSRGKRRGAPTYDALNDPYGLFDEMDILGGRDEAKRRATQRRARNPLTNVEQDALEVLDLQWPVTMGDVKTRYKALAKLHHPDANGGDRDAEERLKDINRAYSTLKGSTNLPAE